MDKKRHNELTMEEEFELLLGPQETGSSVFPSEAARRAAWREHRDEILARSPDAPPCWAAQQYDDEAEDPDEDAAPWRGQRTKRLNG